MLDPNSIRSIIFQALVSINQELSSEEQFEISPETILFGMDAVLDSLSLVSVIVDVEAAISETSGHDVVLTDDRAMSQETSPFSDVGSLTAYILLLLSEPV